MLTVKVCLTCSKSFKPHIFNGKYCSRFCWQTRGKSDLLLNKFICQYCSKTFEASTKKRKYCSEKCFWQAKSGRSSVGSINRICTYCCEYFKVRISVVERGKDAKRGKYCSKNCMKLAKSVIVNENCRRCGSCKQIKPNKEFYVMNNNLLRYNCKSCKSKQSKYSRAKTYGLTREELVILLSLSCICGNKATDIDHNSVTGQVRGSLCKSCNLFLGKLELNMNDLEKYIQYLKFPPAENILGRIPIVNKEKIERAKLLRQLKKVTKINVQSTVQVASV